jgi:predicted O-methyltransferase YrrM
MPDFKFNQWSPRFAENLAPYIDDLSNRPINVLEIGVFEARNALWIEENLLCHPDSRYIGIDNWVCHQTKKDDGIRARAIANVEGKDKITLWRGNSKELLRNPAFDGSTDLCYIDGDHHALPVLTDTILCWQLVKPGGILIWDDWISGYNALPAHKRATLAINLFLECAQGQFKILFNSGNQIGVRKHDQSI